MHTNLSFAQNISGVTGPSVKMGEELVEYRISQDHQSKNLRQRIHYQKSINDYLQPRFVLATRAINGKNHEIDNLKAELKYQFTENDADWLSAVRFDVTYRGLDRPTSFDFRATTETNLTRKTKLRLNIITGFDFGKNSRDGLFVSTRARISNKIKDDLSVGMDLFNSYGSIEDISGLESQSHQIGPYINFKYGAINIYNSVLLGITNGADDINYRMFISRSF